MSASAFAEMSTVELTDRGPGLVALAPIGSIEQHGPHLPVGTDTIIASAFAQAVCEARPDLPLAMLPVQSVALSSEHIWAPGTLSLSPSSLLAVLDDLGASLARSKVRRLAFLNAHGGNSAILRVACREIRVKHGLLTFLLHPHLPVDQGGRADSDDAELGFAIHGGAGETSLMAYLRPDLVDMSLARRSVPEWMTGFEHVGFAKPVSFGWTSADLSASGVIGDPSLADPERGKHTFEATVEQLGLALEEISRFDFPGGRAG